MSPHTVTEPGGSHDPPGGGDRAAAASDHSLANRAADTSDGDPADADHNEVTLIGRVSGRPERRVLPSGDELVGFRLVVRRADGGQDTLPIQVGPAPAPGTRPRAGQLGRRMLAQVERLASGDRVSVVGALRRRWWDAGGTRRSRVEVAARRVTPI